MASKPFKKEKKKSKSTRKGGKGIIIDESCHYWSQLELLLCTLPRAFSRTRETGGKTVIDGSSLQVFLGLLNKLFPVFNLCFFFVDSLSRTNSRPNQTFADHFIRGPDQRNDFKFRWLCWKTVSIDKHFPLISIQRWFSLLSAKGLIGYSIICPTIIDLKSNSVCVSVTGT